MEFGLEIEAVSRWKLDEYGMSIFTQVWVEFVNQWYTSSYEEQEEPFFDNHRPYSIKLTDSDKQVTLREEVRLHKHANIILEMFTVVDRLSLVFLVLQNVLKDLFKASQNVLTFDSLPSEEDWGKKYVGLLVERIRTAMAHYNQITRQVIALSH